MVPKTAKWWLAAMSAVCAAAVGLTSTAAAQTKVRVGWCTSVITNGVVPFAIATKLGWFKELGLEVEIVNLPGSSDCVRNVATGEVLVAVPTVEPVAIPPHGRQDAGVLYCLPAQHLRRSRAREQPDQGLQGYIATYQKYMDWLVEAKLLKERVAADEIVTNDLITDINRDLNIKAVEDALAK